MSDDKQLKRITFLVDNDTYEALREKAYNEHVGMSKLIRDGLPLIINAPVAQPKHGGVRAKNIPPMPEIEPTKGKVEQDSEIGQDRPATPKQAVAHSYPKSAQTGKTANGRRNVDVGDES